LKIDKEQFAQAVLISNKEKLDIEQQLKLYVEAIEIADKYNKDQPVPKAKFTKF